MQMEVIGVITTLLMDPMITLLGIQLQNGDIITEVMTVGDSYTITLVSIRIAILLTIFKWHPMQNYPDPQDIDTIDGEHKTTVHLTTISCNWGLMKRKDYKTVWSENGTGY